MQCALHYSLVLPSCRALFVIHFNLPGVLLADDITLPEWPCWIWQIAVYVNWTRKAYCQCPFTFADVQHWNKCSIEFLNQTNICDPTSFVVHVVAVDYFCNLTMHNGHTGTKGHGRLKRGNEPNVKTIHELKGAEWTGQKNNRKNSNGMAKGNNLWWWSYIRSLQLSCWLSHSEIRGGR